MRAEIKRLVAMPGDRVLLDGSGLYLNGERMPEPYVKQQYSTPGSYAWGLGRDEYLALGDNRDESHDSRHFGPVSGSDLRGRVWYRYGPRDPGFLGGLETRGTID